MQRVQTAVSTIQNCAQLCATRSALARPPAAPCTSKFLQSTHLHMSEQYMAAWKHSQYFLRQVLFLQLQPLVWRGARPSAAARVAAISASLPCDLNREVSTTRGLHQHEHRPHLLNNPLEATPDVTPTRCEVCRLDLGPQIPRMSSACAAHPGCRHAYFCPCHLGTLSRLSSTDAHCPVPAVLTWILGLKALGLRSKMASTALCRVASFSLLFKHVTQLQDSQ